MQLLVLFVVIVALLAIAQAACPNKKTEMTDGYTYCLEYCSKVSFCDKSYCDKHRKELEKVKGKK
ncbi:hypothetical protein Ciccas_011926 [Cichlidogyrus casuarinus]|uniref:Uncharacterized protein n=1 Tax=Cichlidogyrus casuarinus TaxID=1844966 RepID=A0ABD2PPU8_9PLAT